MDAEEASETRWQVINGVRIKPDDTYQVISLAFHYLGNRGGKIRTPCLIVRCNMQGVLQALHGNYHP